MHLLLVPFAALGMLTGSVPDEPPPEAMRAAYQTALEAQVQNALEFVAVAGGHEAVNRVRAAGGDRFDIRDFQKLDCARADGSNIYRCAFHLTVEISGGTVQQTLRGRFFATPAGLAFSEEI